MTRPTIGLALSGGGFRATAFGLGCLRAMYDRDLLADVRVVSGISGGSVLAAMWAYGPADFSEFDASVTDLVLGGLQWTMAKKAITPTHAARSLSGAVASLVPVIRTRTQRNVTRTDALRRALDAFPFAQRPLHAPTHPNLVTVLSATDLRTSNAVRFSSAGSACSAYGRIEDDVSVAEAVSASAAFPLLLPAVERTYSFARANGDIEQHKVAMTDGGVYDNLGLSVLLPGRSPSFTSHVYDVDYVIAVDAGRGKPAESAARFMPTRLARSFDITYRKTQDGGRALLNAAAKSGPLQGFVHAYLGMPDARMPLPIVNLVPVDQVRTYPTNFRAMPSADLEAITLRGEQLTQSLLDFYCPELVR